MIMVGAEMVKGDWNINDLGEVIQNGAEKRKSRDQEREDINNWWQHDFTHDQMSAIHLYINIW